MDKVLAVSDDGEILFQKLTSQYLDEACIVTRQTLFAGGNVSRTLGVSEDEEALAELDKLSIETAKDGISIIAVDKSTRKVVGMAFNKLLIKSQPFFENFLEIFKNSKSRHVIEYIISADNISNLFEHCQVDCVMEILFLGTLPEYRKRGIAKKLCEISVDIAQSLHDGINVKHSIDDITHLDLDPVPKVVYAIFTSFISQKIGEDLGFIVVAEKSNRKIEVGGQVIENSHTETPTAKMEYKILEKTNR